jgi:two-component system, chemotaxis family, response regulator WspR
VSDDDGLVVLLVHDQVMVAEVIRWTLRDEPNVEFHYCSDLTQALSIAEQVAPTVILQDWATPGADGLALLREYRAHPATQAIPVILLSSSEHPDARREAFAAGASDYLAQLPDPIELIARLRYHTRAYINQFHGDAVYDALRRSQHELMRANTELERLANLDGLTGIHNRRCFDEYLTRQWRRTAEERGSLAVLIADVDEFKRYNDTYGHLAGDEVLKQVAAAIRGGCPRPADLAARLGGDEFAMVLPETAEEDALRIAERTRQAAESLRITVHSNVGHPVTLSIGGAVAAPQLDESAHELLLRADEALYEAKRSGKNRVRLWGSLEKARGCQTDRRAVKTAADP